MTQFKIFALTSIILGVAGASYNTSYASRNDTPAITSAESVLVGSWRNSSDGRLKVVKGSSVSGFDHTVSYRTNTCSDPECNYSDLPCESTDSSHLKCFYPHIPSVITLSYDSAQSSVALYSVNLKQTLSTFYKENKEDTPRDPVPDFKQNFKAANGMTLRFKQQDGSLYFVESALYPGTCANPYNMTFSQENSAGEEIATGIDAYTRKASFKATYHVATEKLTVNEDKECKIPAGTVFSVVK
ncbi:MAG: hypothetical protein V4591_00555 [Bdellovibrionota bacterium]